MAIDIQNAKRIVKRILLSNLTVDKSILYRTPLIGPNRQDKREEKRAVRCCWKVSERVRFL